MKHYLKNTLCLAMVFLFWQCGIEPNNPSPIKAPDPLPEKPTLMVDFEQMYVLLDQIKHIERLNEWTRIEERYLDESTEGGSAEYFYQDTTLLKVKAEWFSETGTKKTDYYLFQNKPFMAIETISTYNCPMYLDSATAQPNYKGPFFDPEKTKVNISKYFLNIDLIADKNADIDAKQTQLLELFEILMIKLNTK